MNLSRDAMIAALVGIILGIVLCLFYFKISTSEKIYSDLPKTAPVAPEHFGLESYPVGAEDIDVAVLRQTKAKLAYARYETAIDRERTKRGFLDSELAYHRELQRQFLEARYRQQLINDGAFKFQLASQRPILWVVIVIVLSGVVMCFMQFSNARNIQAPSPPPGGPTDPPQHHTSIDMEISANSLRLKTQVLGLAVLTLSLAFFYLYLERVYLVTKSKTGEVATLEGAKQPNRQRTNQLLNSSSSDNNPN